jgi:predicted DNA-binding protein
MSDRKAVTYQMRTTSEWLERIDLASESLGISRAAYIRMAVNERLQRDGVQAKNPQKKPRKP